MNNLHIPEGLTQTQPIREIIFEYLREAIVSGQLPPGQRLIERDLAERFQASRTPVREALRKLETEGFIEKVGRRGDVVRSVDYAGMKEAYFLRMTLEPVMVRECIAKMTTDEKQQLSAILDEAEICNEKGEGEACSEKLRAFDQLMMDTCGLPKMRGIILNLYDDLRRFTRFNLSQRKRRIDAVQEHREICDAMLNNQSDLAAELTRKHIENSFEQLKKELKKSEQG